MLFENVKQALQNSYNRGLTSLELELLVNKSKGVVYREIKLLLYHKEILREEVITTRRTLILYSMVKYVRAE